MLDGVWSFITYHPEITIIGAITLIQVAPIKLDPWGAMIRAVKKLLVGDLEEKINELAKQIEEDKAIHARAHILRFADGLYNGKHHTKEYFDDMLCDIDDYERYCREHPDFKNNKTVMSVELIRKAYQAEFMVTPSEK